MNPWKLTAIGMALVTVTALVTGLVVANLNGTAADKVVEDKKMAAPAASVATTPPPPPPAAHPARRPEASAPRHVAQAPATPTQATIDACNQYAAQQVGTRDKTVDTVKDVGVGAIVGAAVGAGGGAIAGGGKGAGKGAAIGGLLGAGAGTLYGLNENKKHDEKYRDAYASCMRSKGFAS